MKKLWLQMADRFDARQPRERVTVFVGSVAVILGCFYVLVLDRASLRYEQASKSLQQSEKMLSALREQELVLTQTTALSADAQVGKLIAKQRADNAAMREHMSTMNVPIVSPEKMRAVLSDLISAQKGLALTSIRSLQTEDLLADSSQASAPQAASAQSLYRQGIEITVRGEYRALVEYLRQVEALPWKVQMDTVSLRSEGYPLSSMKIVLHTLSLERPWISL